MEKYINPKTKKKAFNVDDEGKIDADKEWLDSVKKKEDEDAESGRNKTEDN